MVLVVLLASAAAMAETKQRVVLIFGDSLSAGYGLKASESWPSLLQERLGDRYKVVNASLSGETTAGGLTRLPAALRDHKPAIVALELGANDGLRGLPLAEVEKNLASMIELSQRAGAKVLLIAMQLPPNFGEAYTQGFRDLYPALARRYHLSAPPFLLEGLDDRALFQADQIHPVARAQPRLLDNVYPSLAALAR
jgi:acyl-CoA thioesterase-1